MICATCGRDVIEYHQHHILPRAIGGTDLITNIVYICEVCHGKIHELYMVHHNKLVRNGLHTAKCNGKKLGPPTKVTADIIEYIRQARDSGMSFKSIASELSLSVGTIHKYAK